LFEKVPVDGEKEEEKLYVTEKFVEHVSTPFLSQVKE